MKKLIILFLAVLLSGAINVCVAQPIYDFIDENWNAALPTDWTYTNFSRKTMGGVDNSAYLESPLYNFNGRRTGVAQTPSVAMGSNPIMSFALKVVDYYPPAPTPASDLKYSVSVTTNGGTTWNVIHLVDVGQHNVSGDFQTITVNVSAYANQTCKFRITADWIAGDFLFCVDNVLIGTPPQFEDLTAVSITGSTIPVAGTPATYSVTVKNSSYSTTMTPGSYSVKLKRVNTGGDVELASLSGVTLAPLATTTFALAWTPTTVGNFNLYGEVVCTTDQNPADNKTANLPVEVLPVGTFEQNVGDGDFYLKAPAHSYYPISLSQTLYTPTDLDINGGMIESLLYTYHSFENNTNLAAVPIQVWIGETNINSLEDNTWVDPATLTHVYTGTQNWAEAGDHLMVINFSQPYQYQGGNLVVYTYKHSADFGNYYGGFLGELEGYPGKSILRYEFSGQNLNIMHPEAFGSLEQISGFPNVVVVMNATTGTLSGVVKDAVSNAPIAGAEIKLGNNWIKTTNGNGEFLFSKVTVAQNYEITVSAYGYNDKTATFNITAGVVTNVPILLTPMASYTVSGKVTSSYAPNGLAGVDISLKGFQNYENITTDANGNFTIPGVYSGFTYAVKAVKPFYITFSGEITVSGNNQTYNISMIEKIRPVNNVVATPDDNDVILTWASPEEPVEKTYIYDDGTAEQGIAIGANAAEYFGNMFPVNEDGVLTSIELYGILREAGSNPDRLVTADIFDAEFKLVGQSEPFFIPADEWITVPLNQVPYSGTFYAMISWPSMEGSTNFIGMDYDGPYAHSGYSMYSGDGVTVKPLNQATTFECIFLLRANAMESGKSVTYGNIPKAPKSCLEYKIYRFPEGTPQSEWGAPVGTSTTCTYVNADVVHTLPEGIYQNAVVAVYTGGLESEPRLSNAWCVGVNNDVLITVTSNNDEWGTVSGGKYYAIGESVTLTATPAEGYKFVSWTKDGDTVSAANPWIFDATENLTLVGNFEKIVGITDKVRSNVVLYPNPFRNEISISNPEIVKHVQITNLTGQILKSVIFNGKAISTDELGTGVYLITIESHTGERTTYQMIKSK